MRDRTIARVASYRSAFWIAASFLLAAPRLDADIILVSRLSNAEAFAGVLGTAPPQIQTDFFPANLCNYDKWIYCQQGGDCEYATGASTSNSSILLNNPAEGLRVVGDGTATASWHIAGYAWASAKLIVLSFTLTDVSYPYSMTGQLNGGSTATLTGESGTIFEKVGTTLSETGTLPPGNYTLSVDVYATLSGDPSYSSDANFTFALDGPVSTPTPTPTPIPVARATNLSTRMLVGTTYDTEGIGGFIITGRGTRQVLIRGIGPSLSGVIPNAVSDPSLQLWGSPRCFQTIYNFNWRDSQEAEIIATGRAPSNDLESAILIDLAPGSYTAILSSNTNTTGVGLIEIWDLSTDQDSRLANISTRANVGTGDDIVIGGLILGEGNIEDPIIVRGLGPSLNQSGLSGLPDPKLELRNSQGELTASDDNWMDDPNQAAIIQAVGLAPSNGLESAIATTLMPGAYTALLSGVNNATGVGLVEVYDNPVIRPTPTPAPTPSPAPTPGPTPIGPVLEAENALLTGCYAQADPNASNGFRVDGIDAVGDSVTFTQVPAGMHVMVWYATVRNAYMSLYVNDVFQAHVHFGGTPEGSVFVGKEVTTEIPEGSSVKLQFDSGDSIRLDYVQIY